MAILAFTNLSYINGMLEILEYFSSKFTAYFSFYYMSFDGLILKKYLVFVKLYAINCIYDL